jgi:hypothetical protein
MNVEPRKFSATNQTPERKKHAEDITSFEERKRCRLHGRFRTVGY